jgi:hypothetical protein
MVKVSKNQLAQIRKIYPDVPIRATKHSYYLTAYGDELQKYVACYSGKLSKRKRKQMYWDDLNSRRAGQK